MQAKYDQHPIAFGHRAQYVGGGKYVISCQYCGRCLKKEETENTRMALQAMKKHQKECWKNPESTRKEKHNAHPVRMVQKKSR